MDNNNDRINTKTRVPVVTYTNAELKNTNL